MSVTTNEQGDESKNESADSSSQISEQGAATGLNTTGAESGAAEQTDDGAFDAESLEMSFGLPPGSLKDVKDEASALEALKEMTDKTLLAGLGQSFNPAEEKSAAEIAAENDKAAGKSAEGKKGDETKADTELLNRLKALEAREAKREKELTQDRLAEVDRRLIAEVDKWASPKYGVSGSRNYNQTKAVKELRDDLIPNYLGGAQASGLGIPTIEIVARRVRVHSDDTFKPAKKDDKAGSLGTPGKSRDGNDSKQPRNIHAAYQANIT